MTDINIDKVIGANLSRMRTLSGHTQSSLGKALQPQLTAQQVSKYELGHSSLSCVRMLEIAIILKCSISEFFRGVVGGELTEPATRAELELMIDYHQLPTTMQTSVRALVHTAVKEICA